MLTGMLLYKGIEGEEWKELHDAYKELSRAVGVKKPQEAQKGAKNAGEAYYDLTREDNKHLAKKKTRLALWEGHLKASIVALDEALKCVENSY